MSRRRMGRVGQRGVGLVEFSLVAPLFFLLVMVLADFGKAVYDKNTLDAAAREGARRAALINNPTTAQVEAVIRQHSSAVSLPTSGCAYDPTHPAPTTGNIGYIYLSAPPSGGNGTYTPPVGCAVPAAVTSHGPITVTIVYRYQPLTALLSRVIGNGITLTSTSTFTTDY
jgi:Flp pilus assembly protein TadG